MDDLGFHRKYRPKTLEEYIGNEKLKESVRKALNSSKKPQVVLLSGPAGTGKTTMARLLAKEYLCDNRDSVKGACNTCYNCQAMDEFIETGVSDTLTNIREVDVTDSNKKQDMNELLEDASLPSFDGNWKIYILDECHMMSNSAQNRLLKTLEEPPEKVLMILCTTNPEKLLDTILSRCQYKFAVKKPSKKELTGLLKKVCQKEKLLWDSRSLSLIAAKGDFVPRKALIELENVATEAKEVTYDKTISVLNIVSDKYYFRFFEYLCADFINVADYIKFLGQIKMNMELETFVDSLIPFIVRGIYAANNVEIDALDDAEVKQYKELFKRFNIEDLGYLLTKLVDLRENSRDVEAKLMLLGYTGIHRPKMQSLEDLDSFLIIDNTLSSASEEKKIGEEEYEKEQMITEDAKKEILAAETQNIDGQTIATNFSGAVVKNAPSFTSENIQIIDDEE